MCANSNDTLPTTTLENGFEATVVAGTPNPHLNLRKAMGCIIARSYFVKAFQALSPEDQDAYIAENGLDNLAILTVAVADDFGGFFGMLTYAGADSLEDAEGFIGNIGGRVTAIIGDTDEANMAYARKLEALYDEKWAADVAADQLADRMAKLASR